VKGFNISKLAVILIGLGGSFALAPQSRAQSEIGPDHFDGTEPLTVAASAKISAPRPKPRPASMALQASGSKSNPPAAQSVAARTLTVSRRSGSVATKKRTSAAPKSND
jgi:hypothetical protein